VDYGLLRSGATSPAIVTTTGSRVAVRGSSTLLSWRFRVLPVLGSTLATQESVRTHHGTRCHIPQQITRCHGADPIGSTRNGARTDHAWYYPDVADDGFGRSAAGFLCHTESRPVVGALPGRPSASQGILCMKTQDSPAGRLGSRSRFTGSDSRLPQSKSVPKRRPPFWPQHGRGTPYHVCGGGARPSLPGGG